MPTSEGLTIWRHVGALVRIYKPRWRFCVRMAWIRWWTATEFIAILRPIILAILRLRSEEEHDLKQSILAHAALLVGAEGNLAGLQNGVLRMAIFPVLPRTSLVRSSSNRCA